MITFHKYEGAGNDFIMINNLNGQIKLKPSQTKLLCDRHLGIGADGVILIEKPSLAGNSSKAGFFMNYYNSDGSVAEMCGNGIRCAVKFFLNENKNNHIKSETRPCSVNVETRAGMKNVEVNIDDTYSVDMGLPILKHPDFPETLKQSKALSRSVIEGYEFNCVSMGNPHAVAFVENLIDIDLKSVGPKVETNSLFPNKINVEFVEKITPARNASSIADAGGETYYKVKVWERGCGETLACGTGACAVFSIIDELSSNTIFADKEIILEFPGGKLFISKNEQDHIILRGPATFVFKGEI